MSTSKRRRGRRKSGGGGGGGAPAIALAPGSVPTDEQLEEELRELEKKNKQL